MFCGSSERASLVFIGKADHEVYLAFLFHPVHTWLLVDPAGAFALIIKLVDSGSDAELFD